MVTKWLIRVHFRLYPSQSARLGSESMWTKRKDFPIRALPGLSTPPTICTPSFLHQVDQGGDVATSDLELEESNFNCITALGYTLLPQLYDDERQTLLSWACIRWLGEDTASQCTMETMRKDASILAAFTQVEYFMVGTDNGQLFLVPLLPPHLLEVMAARYGAAISQLARPPGTTTDQRPPVNCGPRRLLHRHARQEPVIALDHLGTIVASVSTDAYVAVSMYHPDFQAIVTIPHPNPLRSVKLWEGNIFVSRAESIKEETARGGAQGMVKQQQQWATDLAAEERAALYVFSGDEAATVRLWRVDVSLKRYVLLHVFVLTPKFTGMRSSLGICSQEDHGKQEVCRETTHTVQCMALDGDRRLLVGSENGFYVFALDKLPWRKSESHHCAVSHSLCWDEQCHMPMSSALGAEQSKEEARLVRLRASRLVNRHVWVASASGLQRKLDAAEKDDGGTRTCSRWKPKYGVKVANGAAVGMVSNVVEVVGETPGECLGSVIEDTMVPITFDGGELRNSVRFPLSCVEPVVYPFRFLCMPGVACFVIQVLQQDSRVVTNSSDGKAGVWFWCKDEETYKPTVVAGGYQTHRGLGRHVCVLRSPDIFLTCGYDDGLVKEWHLYDEPELLLRCERRFTMTPAVAEGKGSSSQEERMPNVASALHQLMKKGDGDVYEDIGSDQDGEVSCAYRKDTVVGISCAAVFPPFAALFLVGTFESTIQTFSLCEVQGCEVPRDYLYNGFKTVKLSRVLGDEVYSSNTTNGVDAL